MQNLVAEGSCVLPSEDALHVLRLFSLYDDIRDFDALTMLRIVDGFDVTRCTLESRETLVRFAHEAFLRKYQLTNW